MKQNIDSTLEKIDSAIRNDRRWIIFILVAALILKIIYIVQSAGSLYLKVPILDSRYYDELARDIATGHLIRNEAFFMGPLYPFFLALVYSTFGRNIMLEGIIQVVGGSVTVALTFLIGKKIFRPSIALLAAAMLALYGTATFYEGQLLMMWLGTLLNMLMLFILIKDFGRRRILQYVLAGFILGLSALARANILVFAPVVLVWILFINGKEKRLLRAVVFVVVTLITISPATVHNYVASKDFVLITSNGGVNFYMGNNENATGAFFPIRGMDFIVDPTSRRYVERMLGRDMKPSEISNYWMGRAIDFIKHNPGKELSLLWLKTGMFFNAFEIPQIESFDLAKRNFSIFRLLFMNFWVICALGLLGFLYTLKLWKRYFLLHWFIISYSLSIILFFVTARYRTQIVPVLCLFAGYALVEVLPKALTNKRRRLVPFLLLAVLFYFTRPGLFAFDREQLLWREYIHQGRRLGELGQTENALREINKAVALRPKDPESYIQRAIIYKDSGRSFQAIDDYTKSLEIYPFMPSVRYDLAQVLRRAHMYSAAIDEYLRAIEQDSLMIEAYNNLGVTYQLMKDYDHARKYFEKVIKMDPNHVKAYNNLGVSLAEGGNVKEAIGYFKDAIAKKSGYANPYKNLAMAYIEEKRLQEARENLEHYLKLAPRDEAAAQTLKKLLVAITADSAKAKPTHPENE